MVYFQVSYRCASIESNALEKVRVCEGSQKSIKCSGESKITVTYANYGRLKGSHVCGGPVRTTKCEAENSLSAVLVDCQDKTECVLEANNGKFGDPCVGTKKYLEVSDVTYVIKFYEWCCVFHVIPNLLIKFSSGPPAAEGRHAEPHTYRTRTFIFV